MEREKDPEALLTGAVKKAGGRCYKFVSPGNAGVPDRLVLLPGGRLFFVEVKSPDGKLRSVQTAQIKKLTDLGFAVRVLHGREEVRAFLREEVTG